jgi:hypothetical protein
MEVSMKSLVKISLAAVLLGLGVTAVAAQPLLPQPAHMQLSSDNVLLADYKKYKKYKKHHEWIYSEKYGPRYRHRRHGYSYYYEGWYYPRPYWRPGVSINLGL